MGPMSRRTPTTALGPGNPFEDDFSAAEEGLAGQPGSYQLFFVGSPVMSLLDTPFTIGPRATIWQTDSTVMMKHTDVLTLPSRTSPMLREVRHLLRSRPGIVVTIVQVPFVCPATGWVSTVRKAKQDAETALAALVLLLDDRIAYRRLGELSTIVRKGGREALIDVTRAVRRYDSDLERRVRPREILERAAELQLERDPAVTAGLRCYLSALEQVKTSVGFILLCSALEALCPTRKQSFNKKELIAALADYGIDADEASMRGIVRARAIVHHGFIEDEFLYNTWEALEGYVRKVLRVRLEVKYGWPIAVPVTSSPASFTHALHDEDLTVVETDPPADPIRQQVKDLAEIEVRARRAAAQAHEHKTRSKDRG